MTMDKQPKCEELIDDRLRDRLAQHLPDWDDEDTVLDCALVVGWPKDAITEDPAQLREDYTNHLLEGILSVEKLTTYKVLLSWGGPSDGFEFIFNLQGELTDCNYLYQDWFDGARRPVPIDQAEELAQLFCVGPEFG
jgi:hypothetical protein